MVNVGTGNLLLQEDDMNVPHKGIALAFRRTYNSQSSHDVNGSDGSPPGLFGNGWTNTFDAHVAWNLNAPTPYVSVNDIDGARYDYTLSADRTQWLPPPGQHATLMYDGGCGYQWQKKSGTIYYFYLPDLTYSGCHRPDLAAYGGRIFQIIGRNHNTTITFSYSWDGGNATAGGKVSQIIAATESGLSATLSLGDVGGHRLVSSLTRPDGVKISYNYDASGNLVSAVLPPNNSSGVAPTETYGYVAIANGANRSGTLLQWAASPRWAVSGGTDGGYLRFAYAGSGLSQIDHLAYVDPTPGDGTNTPLQPPPANGSGNASSPYLSEYYTLGAPGAASTPTFRDTDGHMANWVSDILGRPTQTQECTVVANSTCTGVWLVSNETWDAANNRTSDIDARGNRTDYAYDANGNTIAVGQPAPTAGAFRPTSLYSYGSDPTGVVRNNVVAYCDPVATHRLSADWQSAPPANDSLCPLTTAARQFVFSYPAYQPFGRLEQSISPATIAAPSGYHTTYSYNVAAEGGADYGLPTQVQGDAMSQPDPANSVRQPLQQLWYDSHGRIQCYNTGSGFWLIAYDAMGNAIRTTDPDDGTMASTSCTKTGSQPGWNTSTTYTYFADESKASAQTPAQRALGVTTQFTYDLDSDLTGETHAFGCTAAPCTMSATTKFYDGTDRLVEVMLPKGTGDIWLTAWPWMTRYIYDISQNGTIAIPGASFGAHGNLAVTQEYLPVDVSTPPWSWKPTKATAFDSMDRTAADYAFAPGQSTAYATRYAYDGSGQAGLLSSKTDGLNESTTYSYDGLGRQTAVQYQNAKAPTYSKQFSFDANGRPLTETSGLFGTQTDVYDATGVLLTRSVPAYGPIPATTLKYDYYPDDKAQAISATLAPLSQTTPLEKWSYRTDGRRASTIVNYASKTYTLSEAYTSAGRIQTASDNFRTTSTAYDATGQLSSLALPAGTFGNIKHDPEGVVTSFTGYQNYFPPTGTTVTNSLTVRGEVLSRRYSPDFAFDHSPLTPPRSAISANGYIDNGNWNGVDIWDVRTKMPLSQWLNAGSTGQDLSYDAIGRLSSSNDGWSGWNGNGTEVDHTGSYTKAYDAENHVVSQSLTGYNLKGIKLCPGVYFPSPLPPSWASTTTGTFTYVWNIDEHPWIINGSGVIWNGDEPFITMSGGAIASIHIDERALLQPGVADPLLVIDRDMSGEAVSSHYSSGFGGLSLPGQYATACTGGPGGTGTRGLPTHADPISQPRTDGIWDGVNMIQGVRSYDASIGQWSTPDAYKGDVRDPMSQQTYMWNRNNPYAYSDPSGYDPQEQEQLGEPKSIERLVGARGYTARLRANVRAVLSVSRNAPRISEENAEHMFRAARGHVPDTALNRAILQQAASGAGDLVKTTSLGANGTLETYAMKLPSGGEAWAEVRTFVDSSGNSVREITNGGINVTPKWFTK